MDRIHLPSRPRLALALGIASMLASPVSATAPAPVPAPQPAAAAAPAITLPDVAADAAPDTADGDTATADDGDSGEDIGEGMASFYGAKFQGQRTASGEPFDMNEMTAAHRTLPFGTRVRVTNRRNGKSVVVRINDRGPFSGHRIMDLSRAAAKRIGLVAMGHGRVELARLDG